MNTMKRKFSLNLPPVKVPLRSASDHSKHPDLPASSHTSSHRRQQSKDSWTDASSPFICRRPLDAQTERELRVACKLILQNFKPSDADFADVDPRLDFSGPHKRREQRPETAHPSHPLQGGKEVRVHRPTGAPSDVKSAHHAQKNSGHSTKYAVKAYPDLPTLANTSRRRDEREREREKDKEKEGERERGRSIASPTHDTARNAIVRTDIDSDDAKSLSTPLTASTDPHVHSTAPTSVASNRGSHQYESAAAVADAQAAEWMRQELEKRRHKDTTHPDQSQAPHQPPSRTGSIRAGIKEYIFPGSKTLSRSQSKESMRTNGSQHSGGLKRSGSVTGWRSWGLTRLSSSRSSSRPGTSSGRMEKPEHDKKSEVDLNRKLPPLPSLDTWKDPSNETKARTETKSQDRRNSHQTQGPHIANVMRTQDHQQEEYAAAVRRHHRKSGSDTLALRYNNSQPSVARVRSPDHGKPLRKTSLGLIDTSSDFDHTMSSMSSTRNLDETLKFNNHAAQRSTSSISRSPSTNFTTESRSYAPNFSRKISADMTRPATQQQQRPHIFTQDAAYVRAVQISGPPKGKEEQKSTLKKVFGGWMSRKEKKEDWMGQFERRGIKGGVMTQEEAAAPPVVRY